MSKAIRSLLLVDGIFLVGASLVGPIYAIYIGEIGGEITDAGIAWGVFSVASGLGMLLMGRINDKMKENELLLALGYIVAAIGFVFYVFVGSVWDLFLVEFMLGLASAMYSPSYDALYSKHMSWKKAGGVIGSQ